MAIVGGIAIGIVVVAASGYSLNSKDYSVFAEIENVVAVQSPLNPIKDCVMAHTIKCISTLVLIIISTNLLAVSNWQIPVRTSQWHETNKQIYRDLLASGEFDVLVVPLQVREKPVDKISRSRITRHIIKTLEKAKKYRIPNVEFVEKALGEHKRIYKKDDVYALANKLKVKILVQGSVGLEGMELKIQKRSGDSKLSENTPTKSEYWKMRLWGDAPDESYRISLRFDVEEFLVGAPLHMHDGSNFEPVMMHDLSNIPPELMPEVINTLPKKIVAMNKLFSGNIKLSKIETVVYLQLLGMLNPPTSERSTELLFERSLVLLESESTQKYYGLLKSRAYYYLNRRPSGLESLKGRHADDNAYKSMEASLNGDLISLKRYSKKIENPILKLMANIELFDLMKSYHYIPDPSVRKSFDKLGPEWAYFLNRKLDEQNLWSVERNLRVKRLLDERFPIPGYTAENIIQGGLLHGNFNSKKIRLSALEHVRRLLTSKSKKQWVSYSSYSVNPLDYLNFLYNISEYNIYKEINYYANVQGLEDEALSILNSVNDMYIEHPMFTVQGAKISLSKSASAPEHMRRQMEIAARNQIVDAFTWSSGQVKYLRDLQDHVLEKYKAKAFVFVPNSPIRELTQEGKSVVYLDDYPPRHFWKTKYDDSGTGTMPYSSNNLYGFENSEYTNPDYLESELNRLGNRFEGSPVKLQWKIKLKRSRGDIDGVLSEYMAAIESRSASLAPYDGVSKILLLRGEYDRAKKILLKHPLFDKSRKVNKVRKANYAAEIGDTFYNMGHTDIAKHFYRLSEKVGGGSQAQLESSARLALMDYDFKKAAKIFKRSIERYDCACNIGQYAVLLHVFQRSKTAWKVFYSSIGNRDSDELWESAMVGLRMKGVRDKELISWFGKPEVQRQDLPADKMERHLYPTQLAVMMTMTDRKMDPNIKLIDAAHRVLADNAEYRDKVKRSNSYAKMYAYLKLGKYKSAVENIPVKDLKAVFRKNGYFGESWMSYMIRAYIKSGQLTKAESGIRLLDSAIRQGEPHGVVPKRYYFEHRLASAYLNVHKKDSAGALKDLELAYRNLPDLDMRHVSPWYQLLEVSEWLYQDTKNRKFIDFALEKIEKYNETKPLHSWAHAFVAKYSRNKKMSRKALAIAIFLDPNSYWLSAFSEKQRKAAKIWFEKFDPLNLKKRKSKTVVSLSQN